MSNRRIVSFSPFTSDADAQIVVAFHNHRLHEMYPRRQPLTTEEYRARYLSPTTKETTFGITDVSGEIVALGITMHWVDGTNADLQFMDILVEPGHRRRGLGRALLRHGLGIAEANGRTMFIADVVDTVPAGEAFARTVGAELVLREHINIVGVADLDLDTLQRWMYDGPVRAPGYELLSWTDGYPREFDAQIARLFVSAEEDVPLENAPFEPTVETAETVRDRLERTRDTVLRITSVIRHRDSREIVGFSELITGRPEDATLYTTLTAVHREHRGHALGKWLKADTILRAIGRFPHATHIQTMNAFSNAPMLGINGAIGFRPEHTLLNYQASTARIRSYLDLEPSTGSRRRRS